MDTLDTIIQDLSSIAKSMNYSGPTIEALTYLMASGIYKNELKVLTTSQELLASNCTLVNSAIQHAQERPYSVFRGKNQHIIIHNVIPNEKKKVRKYDTCTKCGKYTLVYAKDYDFTGKYKSGDIELIVCDSVIEETLDSSLRKYTRSTESDLTEDLDLYVGNINEDDYESVEYATSLDIGLRSKDEITENASGGYLNSSVNSPYLILTDTDYGIVCWVYQAGKTELVFDANHIYKIKSPKYLNEKMDIGIIKSIPGFDITTALATENGIESINPLERDENTENIFIESVAAQNAGNIVRANNDVEQIFLSYFSKQNIRSSKCYFDDNGDVNLVYLLKDRNETLSAADIKAFKQHLKKAYYIDNDIKITKAWGSAGNENNYVPKVVEKDQKKYTVCFRKWKPGKTINSDGEPVVTSTEEEIVKNTDYLIDDVLTLPTEKYSPIQLEITKTRNVKSSPVIDLRTGTIKRNEQAKKETVKVTYNFVGWRIRNNIDSVTTDQAYNANGGNSSNFDFDSWFTQDGQVNYAITGLTDLNIDSPAHMVIKGDLCLEMVWAPSDTDLIHVDLYTDGDSVNQTVSNEDFYQRIMVFPDDYKHYKLDYEPLIPVNTNKQFAYWDDSLEGYQKAAIAGDIIQHTTYYATWNPYSYIVNLVWYSKAGYNNVTESLENSLYDQGEKNYFDTIVGDDKAYVTKLTVKSGEFIPEQPLPKILSSEKYQLKGWYIVDTDGKLKKFDLGTPITGAVTLYAKYKSTYDLALTVYFDKPLDSAKLYSFIDSYAYNIGETFEPMKIATQITKEFDGITWVNFSDKGSTKSITVPPDAYVDFTYNVDFNSNLKDED